MSRTRPTILFAGALIGALALTGCGAGQVASTAQQVANAPGANVTASSIAVRDAVIVFGESVEGAVYTRGESAPLSMTIVNEGAEPDRLVAATSPFARTVEVSGEAVIPGGRALVVDGEVVPVPLPEPQDEVPSEAPDPSDAPAAAPTAPAAPEAVSIVLIGLVDDIRAGITYPVTLTFERAGEVTVQVPVANSDEPREEAEEAE